MKDKIETIKELFVFVRNNKKWWITPIVILSIIFGIFIILTQNPIIAPFFYAIF